MDSPKRWIKRTKTKIGDGSGNYTADELDALTAYAQRCTIDHQLKVTCEWCKAYLASKDRDEDIAIDAEQALSNAACVRRALEMDNARSAAMFATLMGSAFERAVNRSQWEAPSITGVRTRAGTEKGRKTRAEYASEREAAIHQLDAEILSKNPNLPKTRRAELIAPQLEAAGVLALSTDRIRKILK